MSTCEWVGTCRGVHVEIGRQLEGVTSFFQPCGLCSQVWWQEPSLAEPSTWLLGGFSMEGHGEASQKWGIWHRLWSLIVMYPGSAILLTVFWCLVILYIIRGKSWWETEGIDWQEVKENVLMLSSPGIPSGREDPAPITNLQDSNFGLSWMLAWNSKCPET